MKVSILSSAADYGTTSISAAYENALEPVSAMKITKGFKRLNIVDVSRILLFILRSWIQGNTIICLFNAPILLCGIFPLPRRGRWVGILDWNEILCRSGQKIPFFAFYDSLYRMAFRRMSAVYSPSSEFVELYRTRGIEIRHCDYPLPKEPERPPRFGVQNPLRVLFVGADFIRKGGDLLLKTWKLSAPQGATLTFVCPYPPEEFIEGVSFLKDIKAGTREQESLFHDHDIFVLPTKKDAFGFALLEALNCGMCVITTEGAGAAPVVERFGGIVTPDPESAIARLMQLVQNPTDVVDKRSKCAKYLPEYRSHVNRSLEDIIGRQMSPSLPASRDGERRGETGS